MPYYLIVVLQAFCIYHLYKNKNDYYWFFIILFIPVIGSLIYLITQVYNKRDAKIIQSEITSFINPTKKVTDLLAKVDFADTFQNRINLADAYFEIKDFNNALVNYKKALKDNYGNDYHIIEQIVECYIALNDYTEVSNYASKVKDYKEFRKSRVQFLYGIALYNLGNFKEAIEELKQINQRYSNYNERLVLAKFLNEQGKYSEAKELLLEIESEAQHMDKSNKRKYNSTINEAEKLLKQYKN